jgi:adenylosuccinate synthase
MSVSVVCGVNWGDEGKGRMVDYVSSSADVVVRYQGGNNAGHTVVNEFGKFALHLIPSGIFRKGVLNVLGPGVIVDLEGLANEIDELAGRGVDVSNLIVSDRAMVCFPFHKQMDQLEEARLGARAYGSTKNGIAPAYGDIYLKKGVRIGELLLDIPGALRDVVEWANLRLEKVYGASPVNMPELLAWCERHVGRIRSRVQDTTTILRDAARDDKRILLEAQLGALRDVHYGIYPYTTSSCCLAEYGPVGAGLFGHGVDRVMGVMKAFSTCVGEGPFVTRMDDTDASSLREVAQEYGATTGRPRSIGHFDAVASRYGVLIQGATEIALTKLDSITGRKQLKICTHYEIDGQKSDRFPMTSQLHRAVPVYETYPGWDEDITHCRSFAALPDAAQRYVERIETLVGCHIRYVSVGPERDQLMER